MGKITDSKTVNLQTKTVKGIQIQNDDDSTETENAKKLNLKILWNLAQKYNFLKNGVELSVVPLSYINQKKTFDFANQDILTSI